MQRNENFKIYHKLDLKLKASLRHDFIQAGYLNQDNIIKEMPLSALISFFQDFEEIYNSKSDNFYHKLLNKIYAAIKHKRTDLTNSNSPLLLRDYCDLFGIDMNLSDICIKYISDARRDVPEVDLEEFDNAFFKDLISILESLPRKKVLGFVNEILYNENFSKYILDKINKLESIQVANSGKSKSNWIIFSNAIFKKLTLPALETKKKTLINNFFDKLKKEKEESKSTEKFKSQNLQSIIKNPNKEYKFLRFQGRTLLFEDKSNGRILAIKIQKKDENIFDLVKQKATVDFFNENQENLGLKSKYPQALDVLKVTDLHDFLHSLQGGGSDNQLIEKFIKGIELDSEGGSYAYIYEADKDYFTYLHDPNINQEDFLNASLNSLNDILVLLKNGMIYDQLADLFHYQNLGPDRTDHGRYRCLVDLLRNSNTGLGELEKWKQSVEFVNIRATGLADEGDFRKFDKFIKHIDHFFKELVKEPVATLGEAHHPSKSNKNADIYILAELISEIMFVYEITAGLHTVRLIEEGKATDCLELWEKTALNLHKIYSTTLSMISGLTQAEADIFINKLDHKKYAMQLRYWMTDAYVRDISEKGTIDDKIYSKNAKIYVDPSIMNTKEFIQKDPMGKNVPGPDLGTYGGQNFIKHGDMVRHNVLTIGLSAALVREDFKKLLKEAKKLALQENDKAQDSFKNINQSYPELFTLFKNKVINSQKEGVENIDKKEKYEKYKKYFKN